MREAFSESPLKITCDNMIVRWDHTAVHPDIIWNDDEETMTVFAATTEDIQDGYPFEVLVANYEQIQYIEAYITPKDAMEWLEENKSSMTDENYKRTLKYISQSISKRGYTGTVPMRNVLEK